MATKPIQSTDIASKDVFSPLIADTKIVIELFDVADKKTAALAKNIKEVARGFKANNAGDLQKAVDAEKLLTAEIKEQNKRLIDKERAEKTLLSLQKQKAAATAKEIKEQEQLTNVYKQESKKLNDLRNSYKNLAAQNKENTKEAKDLLTQITKLDSKLKGIDQTVGQSQRYVGAYERGLNGLKGTMGNLMNQASKLGLVLGGGMIIRDGFNTLVEYDEKLADIAKTTGLTVEQADELSKSLLNIDTRTSISNLQELAVAAGRLGITGKENLLSFAESADKVFVALGDDLSGTADEIATNLGKIADVFGASDEFGLSTSIEMTGSALNELSANSKANAGDILDFTNRLAGIGSQAGLTIPQVQALGALFSDTGQSVEVAATTLNVLLPKLADNQKKYAEVAGLTAKEFSNLLQNNPLEALTAVAKGAKNSEGGLIGLNETLKEFGVDSARAASIVGILAGETDKLNNFVNLGNEAYEKNTSLQDEFNIKNETTGALLEKLGKEWDKQVLGIGATTTASNSLKSVLGFLIKNLGTITNIVIKGAIAWGTYKATLLAINVAEKANVAIMALRTGGLKALFTSQTASNASTVAGTAATKGLNTAMKANPIGLLVSALVLLVSQLDLFSSAADTAAKKQEILNLEIEKGLELAQKSITGEQKKLDDFAKTRVKELIDLKLSEKDILKQVGEEYRQNANESVLGTQKEITALKDKLKVINQSKFGQKYNPNTGQLEGGQLPPELMKQEALIKSQIEELEKYKQSVYDLIGSQGNVDEAIQKYIDSYIRKTKGVSGVSGGARDVEKTLTGLAKLQKDLTDLEKLRSDRLVENKGVIDETYITMTAQTRELETQIAAYKLVLDNLGKIEKAEKRGGSIFKTDGNGVITTEPGKSDIDRSGNANYKSPEELLAEEKQRIEDLKHLSQSFTDITLWLTEQRIEALERENEIQQRIYDQSKTREQEIISNREANNSSLKDSLAFERQEQAKALKEQEKIAKKKQRLELINSSLNAFNSAVQSGSDKPLAKTMTDISTLISFIKTIPAFWTGTDTTVGDSLGMKVSNGRDGILARVDASEMILNKGKVDALKGMGITTTDGILEAIEMRRYTATPSLYSEKYVSSDNSILEKKLDLNNELLTKIAKKSSSNIDVNSVGNLLKLTQTQRDGNSITTTTKHVRLGR